MKNPFGELGAIDVILGSFFVAASGTLVYALYGLHDEAIVSGINDVWFQSDLKRVFENMTDRYARGHYRVQVHPLYSLLTYPPHVCVAETRDCPAPRGTNCDRCHSGIVRTDLLCFAPCRGVRKTRFYGVFNSRGL